MSNYSVYRYPGAKSKHIQSIIHYLDPLLKSNDNFIDAFVGGGSVALYVANFYPQKTIFINDKDLNVYSFWDIAVNDIYKIESLLSLLSEPVTIDKFFKLRQTPAITDVDRAHHSIFFNRTTFSGISKAGPIGGKEQKSQYKIDCRFNFNSIKTKLYKIHNLLKNRTFISNSDISNYNVFLDNSYPMYLDPPYFDKGKDLYDTYMKKEDHVKLSNILKDKENWVLSYDNHPFIFDLYKDQNIVDVKMFYSISVNKSNKNEILIIPKEKS